MAKILTVTRPQLPDFEEFQPYLREIWDSRVLTNNGKFHGILEEELCKYLGVEHISLFANGTMALLTALQSLRITGEVITTPYSFVATSHSLLWNGIKPVFVDIDPQTMNMDPARIEAAITPQTTALLPVHCYGRPCDVEAIQKIADTYNLRVVYDAAHAFAVQVQGGSVLKYGDMSVLSFHATKVFNTFEGGAIVCPDLKTKQRIDRLKNFGFVDEITVIAPGINGKMSEFNAALGILQLKNVDSYIARRKQIYNRYRKELDGLRHLVCCEQDTDSVGNYAYFPVLVGDASGLLRDNLFELLRQNDIWARRYFYPLISEFPMYRGLPSAVKEGLPHAFDISRRILCLPIYPDFSDEDMDRVITVIRQWEASCHERR